MAQIRNASEYELAEMGGIAMGIYTAAGPASYTAGGFALDGSQAGIGTVIDAMAEAPGYLCYFDAANAKIKVYQFDYDAAGDGAAIEVAAATDLSGVTFRIRVYGRI